MAVGCVAAGAEEGKVGCGSGGMGVFPIRSEEEEGKEVGEREWEMATAVCRRTLRTSKGLPTRTPTARGESRTLVTVEEQGREVEVGEMEKNLRNGDGKPMRCD
jgi:hypothetical protein